MVVKPRLLVRTSLQFCLIVLATLSADAKPEIVQTVGGFDRPVAAAFDLKGENLYVVNRARGELGAIRNRSFLSVAPVASNGEVQRPNHRFMTGLTAPSDMDFAPVNFGDIAPRGTLFLVAGTPLIENEDGRISKDVSEVFIGIIAIEPKTGKVIRRIELGPNGNLRHSDEEIMVSPSSIAFDQSGNLWIADTGIGGHMLKDRARAQPTVFRLGRQAVMDLLSGTAPDDLIVTKISSVPDDMCYKADEDSVFILANHMQGAPKGAVFRFPSGDFQGMSSMRTIVRELEALSSIQVTPSGRVLLVSNAGDLLYPKGRKDARQIRFRPQVTFSTPGKVGMSVREDGRLLLAVPEETGDAGVNQGHSVSLVSLPAGY